MFCFNSNSFRNHTTYIHRVRAARREYALQSVPNPLEFYGYIYCFSSILAGPAFEYKMYEQATSGKAYVKVCCVWCAVWYVPCAVCRISVVCCVSIVFYVSTKMLA